MYNSLKANVRVKENRVLMFSVEAYDTYDFWCLCIYAEVVSFSIFLFLSLSPCNPRATHGNAYQSTKSKKSVYRSFVVPIPAFVCPDRTTFVRKHAGRNDVNCRRKSPGSSFTRSFQPPLCSWRGILAGGRAAITS